MRNRMKSARLMKVYPILVIFIFGIALGLLAKYSDTVGITSDGGTMLYVYQHGMSVIKDVTTDLGIWIFIAVIIAVFSRSPAAAALHVFVFFIGMLLAYYWYSAVLFGFFPKSYFYRWGLIALFSPVGAYISWHARSKGWIAALCAAPSIALLVAIGRGFYATESLVQGIDLGFGIVLLFIFPGNILQRSRVLVFVVVLFFLIRKLNLVSLVFGGL